MTVGPLSLVVPPALSILAAPLADTTVHVATGFGAQSRRLQDGISGTSVPLRVVERTAITASRREVPVAKATKVGQGALSLSV